MKHRSVFFIHVSSEWVISTNTSSSVARRCVSSRTSQWRSRARRKISSSHVRPRIPPAATKSSSRYPPPSLTSRTPGIFFSSATAVIRADLRFQHHSAGRPNATEQIFRRIARFDPPFVDDDHARASHLDLGQNVGRKQNRVLFAQILDQLPHLADLIRIEADRRFIQNQQIRFVQ